MMRIKTLTALLFFVFSYSLCAQEVLSQYQRKAMDTYRFAQPVNTGINHTLLILGSAWKVSPEIGDEIAVYDADRNMVSSVAWRPEQKGHAGLAIWGDDETTSAKEGMSKGESFSIMYYDKSEDRLQPVEVKRWERGSDVFIKDGVSVVGSLSLNKELKQEMELFQNVPNPVSEATEISFYLPKDSKVHLTVTNTIGQEIAVLASSRYKKGMHTVSMDASGLPAGIYFYKLESNKSSLTKQLNIVK